MTFYKNNNYVFPMWDAQIRVSARRERPLYKQDWVLKGGSHYIKSVVIINILALLAAKA